MKLSKASVRGSARSIPQLRFEDQQLSSFAGIVVYQKLFQRLDLVGRLRRCFDHLPRGGAYDLHRIALLLVVHLLLGYRRLRGMDFYRDDPLVLRCLGWRRMPDATARSSVVPGCALMCVIILTPSDSDGGPSRSGCTPPRSAEGGCTQNGQSRW